MARRDALLRLHKSLLARRQELLKRLGADLDDMGTPEQSSVTGDSADAAFDHTGEELASQLAEIEAKELIQIDRALMRLKQGTYGKCEGCGAKIPVIRLNALPYSTLCVKCQREVERDASWLESHNANWAKIDETTASLEDREVNLSDLEIDFTK